MQQPGNKGQYQYTKYEFRVEEQGSPSRVELEDRLHGVAPYLRLWDFRPVCLRPEPNVLGRHEPEGQ